MRKAALIGLLVGLLSWGEIPVVNATPENGREGATTYGIAPGISQEQSGTQTQDGAQPQTPNGAQSPMPSQAPSETIMVPAGTSIQLALTNPITTKSMKTGTPLRAVVSFPVSVGSQVAIPVNTYVEGMIDGVQNARSANRMLRAHFTRVIFANGYTVPLAGEIEVAQVISPEGEHFELASYREGNVGESELAALQQQPPPPLPKPGTSSGEIAAFVAVPVVGVVLLLLAVKHNGGANGVVFDSGYQLEMVLRAPLTLDAASVPAASAT
jgi:hypothetical protein